MSLILQLEACYDALFETGHGPFRFHSMKRLQENLEILQNIAEAEETPDAEKARLKTALGLWYAARWENRQRPEEGLKMALERLKTWLDKKELRQMEEAAALIEEAQGPEPHRSSLVLILRDALTAYYAHPKIIKRLEALQEELKQSGVAEARSDDWYKMVLREIRQHHYATPYAQAKYDRAKGENLRILKKWLKRRSMVLDTSVAQAMKVDEVEISRLRKKLAKIQGVPERGIETWYRLASRNLYTRRQILNTKSSILLTVNSIILSIALGTLYPKLQEDWHLAYALVPLVLTNLFSIVFAVLATRPQLQSGMFAPEDVDQKTAHLMTFDDYFNMPQADFESAVDQIMQDRGFLYGTIKRDLYRLGKDLSRRYKNIRIAYNVFLFGIIFSVLMFGVCHLLF